MSNATDNATRNHLAAAARLVQCAMGDAAAEDREGVEGLLQAMKAGALLTLHTTLTTTGLASVAIDITAPSGEPIGTLMKCELERAPLSA